MPYSAFLPACQSLVEECICKSRERIDSLSMSVIIYCTLCSFASIYLGIIQFSACFGIQVNINKFECSSVSKMLVEN